MGMISGLIVLVSLSGGQFALPLGLPPLAEDPVLAKIAPDECLAYYSWSGVGDPNPRSKNQTEQMLAEPEVKEFVAGLGRALAGAIRKGAPATTQGQVLGMQGPKLMHVLLTHPTALFLSKLDVAANGADISGGAVIATGSETAAVQASLDAIEKVLLTGEVQSMGAKWHRWPAVRLTEPIEWGFRGEYLIVGIGTGSADAIDGRLNGRPPAWLTALKTKLPVERVSTVLYLNVKRILGAARPALTGPEERPLLDAIGLMNVTGLANVRTVATVGGLEGTGCVWKSWVQTERAPSGLLSIFGRKSLRTADLAAIPKDASFAAAARIDPARVYEAAMQVWKHFFSDAALSAGNDPKPAETFLGFRLKEDLFDTLGDTCCLYNSPGEGGLLLTGLTFVVSVKDANRLRKTNERLVALSSESGLTAGPTVKKTTFRGQRIYFLNSSGNEFFPLPLPFAWCVSDTHLIFSLSPQNIRSFLARDAQAGSLADIPAVAERLKSGDAAVLTYQDTAGTLKIVYPILQIMADITASSLQQEGLDLDIGLLPSLASIIRHVEPGVGTVTVESDGLIYVNRQSLPIGEALPNLTFLAGFSLASGVFVSPAVDRQTLRFRNFDGIIRVERLEPMPNR